MLSSVIYNTISMSKNILLLVIIEIVLYILYGLYEYMNIYDYMVIKNKIV